MIDTQHRKLFVGAVIAQVFALGLLTLAPLNTLATGKVYTFETIPVDPWDMFRGEYVRLAYPFNRIPTKLPFTRGQKIYSVLSQDRDGKWQAVRFAAHKLKAGDREVVLAGTVGYASMDFVDVSYGIEQVFVPEGTGKEAERARSLKIDVAVSADGNAVLLVDVIVVLLSVSGRPLIATKAGSVLEEKQSSQ